MPTRFRLLKDADVRGKRVLLRAGFDVPVKDGIVTDDSRILSIVPSMKDILSHGGVLVLMAHQGRPKGKDEAFSQRPLVPVLERLLGTAVHFADDCIGEVAVKAIAEAKPGDAILLENLRFHPEEKAGDASFAAALAALGDIYVNDAFSNSHRPHASMVALARLLPSYMGMQLEQEVSHLQAVVDAPARPLALIVSGAKMETKVPVIKQFLAKGDHILLGGCIANTFLRASGMPIGSSKYEEEHVPLAKLLLDDTKNGNSARIHLPIDVVTARDMTDAAVAVTKKADAVSDGDIILDIGPDAAAEYADIISRSKSIVWNGPLGYSELPAFADGTKWLAKAILDTTASGAVSVIGGGDTLDFHARYQLPLTGYTFASTGGGAMLEFLAGERFEAIEVLTI